MLAATMAISAFVIGFIKTCFGVGTGQLVVPALSLLFTPQLAVGMVAPLMLLSDGLTLAALRGRWLWRPALVLAVPSIVGVALGGWLLSHASSAVMRLALGAFAIGYGQWLFRHPRGKATETVHHKETMWFGGTVGLLGGVASSLAHTGGIVYSAYLLSIGLVKEPYVATLTLVFLAGDLIKVPLYTYSGIATPTVLLMGAISLPTLLVGTWLGRCAAGCLSPSLFRRLMAAVMMLMGAFLLLKAAL